MIDSVLMGQRQSFCIPGHEMQANFNYQRILVLLSVPIFHRLNTYYCKFILLKHLRVRKHYNVRISVYNFVLVLFWYDELFLARIIMFENGILRF